MFHGDLSPSSVKVAQGVARIADFGHATLHLLGVEEDPEREPEPIDAAFMAPEVLERGPALATEATDVWGLGAVAAWLFQGRAPFEGENMIAVAMKVMKEPPLLPSVHRAAIERALSKAPEDRFASVKELRRALEAGP